MCMSCVYGMAYRESRSQCGLFIRKVSGKLVQVAVFPGVRKSGERCKSRGKSRQDGPQTVKTIRPLNPRTTKVSCQ
jgi:hypothetical protein